MTTATNGGDRGKPRALTHVGRERTLPLSFGQERLRFLEEYEASPSKWNLAFARRWRGQLDVRALEHALNEVAARHEALRTNLSEHAQVIAAPTAFALPVVDVAGSPDPEAEAGRRVKVEAEVPFDVQAGPVFRLTLYRLGEADHVLLLVVHHAFFDGISFEVFERDLLCLYDAFRQGLPSPLAPLTIQYADYAVWHREWLEGARTERQLAYWKEQLEDVPNLDLPTDRPRPARQTFIGAAHELVIPESLASAIVALSRAERVTPFMVMQAAFVALMSRYSGQTDISVGTPVANRPRVELESMIGFFVNRLVLRNDLSREPSTRELLARVRTTSLTAYGKQDVSFERVVEAVAPARDPSRGPLAQVMFSGFTITPRKPVEGLSLEWFDVGFTVAHYDLGLVVDEASGTFRTTWEYNVDLFDAGTIERFARHLLTLLAGMVAAPDAPVARLPILDEDERARVLVQFNAATPAPPRARALVHELFAQQASRTPAALALTDGAVALTYEELDAATNRLARLLRRRGVTAESRVIVAMHRSAANVLARLAILKAGGAFAPVDASQPAERTAFMIREAGAPVVLSVRGVDVEVPAGVELVRLDADDVVDELARESSEALVTLCSERQLAYVIFTSGTTGRPKAAMIEHDSFANMVEQHRRIAGMQPGDRATHMAGPAFDATTNEIWPALTGGAALHVVSDEIRRSPRELVSWLRDRAITVAHMTTPLAEMALEEDWSGAPLRVLFTGGQALTRRPHGTEPFRLVNIYGPTEATDYVTFEEEAPGDGPVTTIGKPIQHAAIYILDASDEPAPIGVYGELCAGGVPVGRGYLGRPDLTAARFVPDPFSPEGGRRMYRTGDFARWLPDGTLEFRGRRDDQVKLRGFRIELGEIEATLKEHPRVRAGAVIVREDTPGDKRIVAYVVAQDAAFSTKELRAHLEQRLPEYMVPSAFVVLPALPLTRNGKVDRAALPAPDLAGVRRSAVVEPRTPVEQVLASIWSDVLGVERVSVLDDFFELGGHSLLAMRVASRIRRDLSVKIPVGALFESKTVRALATFLDAQRKGREELPIEPAPRTGPLAMSFAQERLWFLDQYESGTATFNLAYVLRWSGPLDLDALVRALDALVERHESLRTTFSAEGAAPHQVVAPPGPHAHGFVDVGGDQDPDAEARRLATLEAARPFDLSVGPLFRSLVVRVRSREHLLVLTMHHVISDGWSIAVLHDELIALYGAFVRGEPSPLAPLALTYADFAAWQRRSLEASVLKPQVAFWREELAGASVLELPTDRPRPPVRSSRGKTHSFVVDARLTRAVSALGRREGASTFMVVASTFAALLGRLSRQTDLTLGIPAASRSRVELEPIVGFFVNALPLRLDLSGRPTTRQLLGRVRKKTLASYANHDVPFERLVEELRVPRDPSRTPIFQVHVSVDDDLDATSSPEGVALESIEVELGVARLDLAFQARASANAIVVDLAYSTDLFDVVTVERMSERFVTLLDAMIGAPEAVIDDLPIVDARERQRLVGEWSSPRPAPARSDESLHALVSAQAARTPDALALSDGSSTLTYGELAARATALAVRLAGRGVRRGDVVALLLPRDAHAIVAMLGILEAGAAYLTIDPALPEARVRFILDDSDARLALGSTELASGPLGDRVVTLAAVEADAAPAATLPAVDGRDLAYIIYTSGSTGTPKGACIEHRSIAHLAREQASSRKLSVGMRHAQYASLSFDAHVSEVWPALVSGASLHVVPDETRADARAIVDWFAKERVHWAFIPTQVGEECLKGEWPDVQLVGLGFGGDTFHGVPPRTYPFDVLNVYGPTECTCVATSTVVAPGDARPSIGRPIGGVRIYVAGDANELVPTGTVGEICIGGDQVGRGYLRRPDLTAERFAPDPFSSEPGARMYRTGDLGRWRSDGTLEHLGRVDHQVKVRGFRIELGEIEAALAGEPNVAESVVVVREDRPGDKRVIAYVVPKGPAEGVPGRAATMAVGDLRSALKQRLPEYMVPSAIVTLPAFEVDVRTGKVDRRRLPAPDTTALDAAAYVAPVGPTEERLAALWREVLDVPQVGAEDNFFGLGGHSLLAVRVKARVGRDLGVDLPVSAIFTSPTLRALARTVDALAPRSADDTAIRPVPRDRPLALSFTQERLWFLDQLEPGSTAYLLPTSARIEGALDVAALERTIAELLRRHEVLRTSIVAVDGAPTQVVRPVPSPALAIVDRTGATEAELQALVDADASTPFDLAQAPFRATLVRVGEQDHLLLVCIHHIASDGWSKSILDREISALYEALSAGKPSPLPPLPLQYADYAAWQREQMTGPRAEDDVAYWKAHLAGAPPALDLPTDRPHGPVQSHRGEVESLELSPALTAALNEASRASGASLFMTMLAAFSLVLSRQSGQEDVVVGVPVAERSRPELEGLIGLILNTIALRMTTSGGATFRELVARARDTSLAGFAHQDVPFEKLVDELGVERNLARSPIFQVMLVSTKFDADAVFGLPGLTVSPADTTTIQSKYDLTLYFDDDAGALRLWLTYAADLFDRVRMRELLAQVAHVLEQAAARPDAPVHALSLVTPRSRELLPDPKAVLDPTWRGAVTEIFARHAAAAPDRLAIEDATDSWTYGELDARSNQLARRLLDAGCERGERVAIVAHRSASLACAVLGVMKAGAAFVMLDPAYPADRILTLLEASGACALVRIAEGPALDPAVAEWLDRAGLRARLDLPRKADVGALFDGTPSTAPGVTLSADDLAYVAFTSGSTGTPKGVAGRHGPLTHFNPWLCREFGLGPDDRFTMLSGLAHDPLHRDLFTPFQLGASVHVLATEEIHVPGRLAAWMASERVTVAHMTPAFGQLLTDSAEPGARIDSLRRVFLVGDVLTKRDVDRMRAIAPNLTCVNYYGSTETQRAVSYHVVVDGDRGPLPLGRGMPNVQLLVVNAAGKLAGVGEVGELVFRSPHLARGYINDAELSAVKFVESPLGPIGPGDRAYRTGDLGRYLPSGEAVFAGRADRQVKIRGFRVEPTEIEGAIASHPAVREVVVLAREDVPGDKRLVAYFVCEAGVTVSAAELRELVGKRLPDYMVPSAFVTLDAMPVTPNGKLDRAALPAPTIEAAGAERTELRGGVEEILGAHWCDVLRLEGVGATDNFFALGGNSLLAVRLVARVRRDLGVELPVRAFFTAPSIRALAAIVEEEKGSPSSLAAAPLVPTSREQPPTLSFTQERLWFLGRLEQGSSAYTVRGALRLAGELSLGALERAIDEIQRRHDVLRMTFHETGGGRVAGRIAPPSPFSLPVVDMAGATPDDVRARIDDELSRPFDLTSRPVRFTLLGLSAREHVLVVAMHHIVADGWSMQVFDRELCTLYEAFVAGRPSPLAPLPLQFADYARWQQQAMSGPAAEKALAYWLEHLAGAPPSLDLPTDRPHTIAPSHRGETESIELPLEVVQPLRQLGRSVGASTFMTVLAAFSLLLSRQAGQDDVVVGVPIAHRPSDELEGTIGLFLNTLALRMRISPDASFRDLLVQARETSLSGYAHQEVPFETVVERLQPERSLARTPVFQVMLVNFNFQKEAARAAGGLEVSRMELPELASKFDITAYIDESGDRVSLSFSYAADVFDRRRMKELLAEMAALLARAVERPDAPARSLSLLTPTSAEVLPDPSAPLGDEWHGSVADVFARRAAEAGDRLAVADARDRWTYAELAARSNQLAHRLLRAGCEKGDRVAILAHRSASLAWAVLGVLEAGAAFVIVDPAYPAARQLAILEGARPRAVVRVVADTPIEAEVSAWLDGAGLRDRIDLPRKGAIGAAFDAHPTTRTGVSVTADDLAYVAFTSGSTGKPKGILGRHGPLSHFQPWRCREFELTADDRFSMLSGLAHDPLHRDLFTPLQLGASLHVIDPDEMHSPGRLAEWMKEERITVAHLTPAFIQVITDFVEDGTRLDALRRAFLVGDALTRRDVARLREIAPNVVCVNYYGATETQQALAYHVVSELGAAASDAAGVIPVGRGTPDVQLLVLTPSGALAGVGELGEICFRSPHLARGYLDDPELTDARFVRSPFGSSPADRLYRTGDLGRYTPDGEVVFAGRADRQVKIRGFRVELSEIEARLTASEGVREAVVIVSEPEPGDRRLVAYVVMDEASSTDPLALRDALAEVLPSYMLPSAIVKIAAIPLTPNGKIDRSALPSPDAADDWGAALYEAPRTPLEEAIVQVWQDVLQVERVGIHDDYFTLGGHSLNAMQMIARLRQRVSVAGDVLLRQIFLTPTVAALAVELEASGATVLDEAAEPSASVAAEVPLTATSPDDPIQLSFTQERLWFLGKLEPESVAYTMPSGARLIGDLSMTALEKTLEEILRRHEILRMTVEDDGGRARVRIAPVAPVSIPIVDVPGADREEIKRQIARDLAVPFDLTKGVVRFTLLRVSSREHVLLAPMHHLVTDGWSTQLFNRELSTLYAAFVAGEPSPLAPLRLQYRDYAAWQRAVMSGEGAHARLDFWLDHLAGAPPALELPTDRPYAPITNRRAESETLFLSKEMSRAVQLLGQASGASTFMTVLAAFSAVLARQAGQEEVVVGVPVAHRPSADLEDVIGLFLNTLALRLSVAGNPSFREMLVQARDTTLAGFENQDIPFETIVERLHPDRSLVRTPIFQVMCVGLKFPKHSRVLPGLQVEPLELPTAASKFDITLYVMEMDDQIELTFDYAADFFDRARMKELLGALSNVLARAVERPDTPVKALSLVTQASRRILPEPAIALPVLPQTAVHRTVFELATRAEADVALEFGDVRWTFAELEARSRSIAAELVAAGVTRGARVLVTGVRSPALIASLLAVWSIGAVIVPIGEDLPDERRQLLATESGASLAIVVNPEAESTWEIPALRIDLVTAAVVEADRRPTTGKPAPPEATEADPAYVFFTSGTTGKPKGVLGQHRGLAHFLAWQRGRFEIGPGDRAAQLTGLGFDVVMRDVFTPLTAGATLCIPHEAVDSVGLLAWMRERSITLLHSVPSVLSSFLTDWEGAEPLTSVRLVFMAGEPLNDVLVGRLRLQFPNARIINLYGPTETTLAKCFYEVPAEPRAGIQPVGRPLPQTQVLVLNEAGIQCGIGEPGEIVIRTPYRTLGYLGDEHASRFQPNPFTGAADDTVYRTGDRGRYGVDGELEILGRIDDQVKILGVRVEPAEVAAVMLTHPCVGQCFVTAFKNPQGQNALAAYVVLPGTPWLPDEAELRAHMSERLPRAMVPSAFVVLEKMPLSPNGKVDRKALPAPELGAAEAELVPPRTPLEETIAAIWREVLKADRIGVHDDYFALGGHSLNAMQMMARLSAAVGVQLPLRLLFDAFTIATLAEVVQERVQAAGAESSPAAVVEPMPRADRSKPIPASFGQSRLWFLDQLEPGSYVYNNPSVIRLERDLDVDVLGRALEEIVSRHEALRTTFTAIDGEPHQIIHPPGPVAIERFESASVDEARALVARAVRVPFDLANGPMVKPTLVRLPDGAHLLVINVHHIANDGWSVGVLERELTALYAAFREGRPSPLAPLAYDYADFAVWQRARLTGEALETHLAFWRRHLEGAPAALELPTDRPRPALRQQSGASVSVRLSAGATARMKALCSKEGVTPFMLLLAGFQAVLSRWSGQSDVVVGTPIAGRARPELEGIIGIFINMLAIRTRFDADATTRQLLRQVKDATLDAFAHQELPFEKLVDELDVPRDTSRTPVFQAMFAWQNIDGGLHPVRELEATGDHAGELGSAQFDLSLVMYEHADVFRGSLSYDVALFDRSTIERLVGHLLVCFEAMTDAPDACVAALPLLSEAERRTLLVEWNDTREQAPERTVYGSFSAQVERAPDAIAVAYGEARLTYRELRSRAERVAAWLAARGVRRGSQVAIEVGRSELMVAALLGVMRVGAAYVPIDPELPEDRRVFMREDARATLTLTDATLAEAVAYEGQALGQAAATLDDVAYVLYTSGSTGRPKGVMVSHGALASFVATMAREPGLTAADTLVAVTTLSFDIAGLELFLPLTVGARVVIASRMTARDPVALAELLERAQATVMQATPATWAMLVASGWRPNERLRVFCGGEAIPADLADTLAESSGGLWNLYGPTETTIWSTCTRLRPGQDVTIGRPIGNTQTHVLDARMEPTPTRVFGELCIGGAGVAVGYLGRPELTAERFVPDPFAAVPGARMYRTGDLARWRADGQLEFIGRIDHQVKLHGFRIELGEIESALTSCTGVARAVVLAREDVAGDKRLVGYVVPEAGATVSTEELKDALGKTLPDYMVPSAFVVLDTFPLSPSGKVDRKALPAPDFASEAAAYVAPRDAVEEGIAGIWQDLLGVPRVGVNDDFFALGGHSLLATRVVARMRAELRLDVALRVFFEAPTISGLVRRVAAAAAEDSVAIPRASRERPLRASFAQERLWFVTKFDGDTRAYHLPLVLRISGALDYSALERSLREIVRRHEVLRTTLSEGPDGLVQVIQEDAPVAIERVVASGASLADRQASAREALQRATLEPFDLERGPMFRATVIEVGDGVNIIVGAMHHVSTDGWSLDVLSRELRLLYEAFSADQPSPLEELTLQYADYAVWQRRLLDGPVLQEQLGYWRQELAGAPWSLDLPTDRPRPAVKRHVGASVTFELSAKVAAGLREVARAEGVTLFMVLLAGYSALLGRWAGQKEVVVGTPIAGRTRAEVEAVVGLFVNTLALRMPLDGDPTFRELVARAKRSALGAFANQDVPFERIVEEVKPPRDPSRTPVFEVMLSMANAPGDGETRSLGLGGTSKSDVTVSKFDLTLNVVESGQRLIGSLEYDTDLFDRSTIERMASHIDVLLEGASRMPDRPVASLPLMTASERQRVVREWNATDHELADSRFVHELIAARARRTPRAVALVFGAEQMTYEVLDAESNRLANALRARGVGRGKIVALCMERSLELLVAVLGVLKAGAAYAPLDPTHPPARLELLAADLGAPVVLTTASTAGPFASRPEALYVDRAALLEFSAAPLEVQLADEDLAYVIFTSGSTGTPKAVMSTHGGIRNRLLWGASELPIGPRDTVLHKTPYTFDVSVWELLLPLMTGARIIIAEPEGHRDPAYLTALVREHAVTMADFVPSMLAEVLESHEPETMTSLRRVLCGGEALPRGMADRFFATLKCDLVNMYGPTETAIDASYWHCSTQDRPGEMPIGRPVWNTQLYVLDRAGLPCPIGVAGELVIGGVQVARGYLNRPELTAERFVPDPFSAVPGRRMYRTGDLACWRADGAVMYLGRIDHQVKLHGQRIELGEIESALASCAGVARSVVLAREDVAGDKRLVGYVVAEPGATVAAQELKEALRKALPDYMVPGAFVVLDALPLTSSGKVDRKALPAPDFTTEVVEYVAPRTKTEETIATVFAEVLKVPRVGIHDDFFGLGGHSLLATKAMGRIRAALGIDAPVRALFEAPTPAELAATFDAAASMETGEI